MTLLTLCVAWIVACVGGSFSTTIGIMVGSFGSWQLGGSAESTRVTSVDAGTGDAMGTENPLDRRRDVFVLGATRASVVRLATCGTALSVSVLTGTHVANRLVQTGAHAAGTTTAVLFSGEVIVMMARAVFRWARRHFVVVVVRDSNDRSDL